MQDMAFNNLPCTPAAMGIVAPSAPTLVRFSPNSVATGTHAHKIAQLAKCSED